MTSAPPSTLNSGTDLSIGHVPQVDDPVLYRELLDIHNALEILQRSSDVEDDTKLTRPLIWQVINSAADFVQDANCIYLEDNTVYIAGAPLSTGKQFKVGKNVSITAFTFGADAMWTYTGTLDMFVSTDYASFAHRLHSVSCPNANQIYNFSSTNSATGTFQLDTMTYRSLTPTTKVAKKFGTFHNANAILINNSSAVLDVDGAINFGVDDGITITGTIGILSITKFAQITTDPGCKFLEYTGALIVNTYEISNMNNISTVSGPVWIEADPFSANIAAGIVGSIRDCEIIGPITPLVGVTVGDIRYRFKDCAPVRDSTIAAQLRFNGSVLVTTIVAPLTPTYINALWSDGEIEERLCFLDKVTFDFTTDTCTTQDGPLNTAAAGPKVTFNHNFTVADSIVFVENGGLPTGLTAGTRYYVGNLSGANFKLYEDAGLTIPVSFTDNGTGPNYYCHTTGTTASGCFFSTSEQDVRVRNGGWIAAEKNSGGNADVQFVVMKLDTSFNITEIARGARFNARNGLTGHSTIADIEILAPGEGILYYIENGTGTISNDVTDAWVTCTMA